MTHSLTANDRPHEATKTKRAFEVVYTMPNGDPARSTVDATDQEDAGAVIIGRWTDRRGVSPTIKSARLVDDQRPLPHRV